MIDPILLTYNDYEATFLPSRGMNLISFKKAGVEVIDQATKDAFEERYAGLGALIGPHFYRRKEELLPKIDIQFPQSAYCEANGIKDVFSHGVARYVPWKWDRTEKGFKAVLSGKETWYGVSLATIEAQNFQMGMEVSLDGQGLHIELSVVSDTDSIVGIHYYYRLPNGKGIVRARVKEHKELFVYTMDEDMDSAFHPYPNPLKGEVELETDEFVLRTHYESTSQESSFQLYHPKGASFICIEPVSAQDPRHANLSASSILVHLSIG